MDPFLQSLSFGLAVAFILIGIVGILIPLLPGILLVWLTVLLYAILEGFQAIDPATFTIITIISLVTGTADLWMSLLGAKTGGASKRAIAFGLFGSLIGFILGTLFVVGGLIGAIIGYVGGVLLGQYHKYRDWNLALKASIGGLAGLGIATAVQLGGGLLILLIFIWQVLSF